MKKHKATGDGLCMMGRGEVLYIAMCFAAGRLQSSRCYRGPCRHVAASDASQAVPSCGLQWSLGDAE